MCRRAAMARRLASVILTTSGITPSLHRTACSPATAAPGSHQRHHQPLRRSTRLPIQRAPRQPTQRVTRQPTPQTIQRQIRRQIRQPILQKHLPQTQHATRQPTQQISRPRRLPSCHRDPLAHCQHLCQRAVQRNCQRRYQPRRRRASHRMCSPNQPANTGRVLGSATSTTADTTLYLHRNASSHATAAHCHQP